MATGEPLPDAELRRYLLKKQDSTMFDPFASGRPAASLLHTTASRSRKNWQPVPRRMTPHALRASCHMKSRVMLL